MALLPSIIRCSCILEILGSRNGEYTNLGAIHLPRNVISAKNQFVHESSLSFPGQGSQAAGMGADVFPRYEELVSQVDNELGYSSRNYALKILRINLARLNLPNLHSIFPVTLKLSQR